MHIESIREELLFIINHKDNIINLEKELEVLENQLMEYEHLMNKENKDVENLQKISFKSILHSLIGNKDRILKKEKKEADDVRKKYQSLLEEVEYKKNELALLKKRIGKENELYKILEEQLKEMSTEIAEVLDKHLADIKTIELELKEIEEAIEAGESTKSTLEIVISYLKSADNWGTLDVIGGGSFSGIMKHSNYNKAVDYIRIAKDKIQKFQNELKDVYIHFDDIPQFDNYDFVMDLVFDNIFTDMRIINQINKSKREIQNTLNQINEILDSLYNNRKELLDKVKDSYDEYHNLLLKI